MRKRVKGTSLESLDLLEAAYRLDGSERDWIQGLASTASRTFDGEATGFVVRGARDDAGRTVVARVTGACASGGEVLRPPARVARARRRLPPGLQERLFFAGPLATTASQATGLGERVSRQPAWPWDPAVARDALWLRGPADPLTRVVLGIALREPTVLTARQRNTGERLAAHLGSAFRLRAHRCGHLPHRGDLSADHAAEIWHGLRGGRWSLVDYIDGDGRVFAMARRNHAPPDVAGALTRRQRQAVTLASAGNGNKQIAHEMGLTTSAVAMLLARARARTSLGTRAELVRAFHGGPRVPA